MNLTLLDLFLELGRLTVYKVAQFVPRDKNLWVFGAWFGKTYSDNSKYLFEHVSEHHPEVRAVWLTENRLAYENARKQGREVYFTTDPRGLWAALRAGVAIACVGVASDLPSYAFSSQTTYVQLWHGVGPKGYPKKRWAQKAEQSVRAMNLQSRIITKIVLMYTYMLFGKWYNGIPWLPHKDIAYALATTTSKLGKEKLIDMFGLPEEKIAITGYPRHDAILRKKRPSVQLTERLQQAHQEGALICLYAPTHRDLSAANFLDLENLHQELRNVSQRILFLIKLHELSHKDKAALRAHDLSSNVVFVTEKDIEQDIYTILPDVDVLISDYSSIYTDYLLLNKPILFHIPDLETYTTKDQSFFMDFDKVTPGPMAATWKEVFTHLNRIEAVTREYAPERQRVLALFHEVRDGQSCERIVQAIRNGHNT